jgi:hypothetical protein
MIFPEHFSLNDANEFAFVMQSQFVISEPETEFFFLT